MSTVLPKNAMSEEDIKLQYISPAVISIPNIDTQLDIIEKVDRIRLLEEKIAGAKLQMEEFEKAYCRMFFEGIG